MSSLALVTGRLAPGVWRSGSVTPDQLARLAEGLGWDVRRGTLAEPDDKRAYLSHLGAIAGVPDYVSPNWDGMADGLRDLDLDRRCLLLLEVGSPSRLDSLAVEILQEAADFWRQQGRDLHTVWFGEIDAPALDEVHPPKRSRRG